MNKATGQFDFSPHSVEEFMALLQQELPFWEEVAVRWQKLITAAKRLSAEHISSEKLRYRIWAEGKRDVVDDLSKYEAKKNEYELWIDRDEKKHESTKNPGATISLKAVDLAICLVERLGKHVLVEEVLRRVWDEEIETNEDFKKSQYNKIELQLTKLQNFCGGGFRKYLFDKKFEKGIGLKTSFRDKYFIFERLG